MKLRPDKITLYWIIGFFFYSGPNFGQDRCLLNLKDNRLKGKCENAYFTGFEIELDSVYSTLDSSILFSQFPRIGNLHFKNRDYRPTEFTITHRSGMAQILFRFRSSYFTFDDLFFDGQSIHFTIDLDPKVPVVENDLRIIRIARSLLSNEANWHQEDDRLCHDDLSSQTYSIYCALRLASLEVEEKYNHRNAVMQRLRQEIEDMHPNRVWQHRLMEFNNMNETKHVDVIGVLEKIEKSILADLDQ